MPFSTPEDIRQKCRHDDVSCDNVYDYFFNLNNVNREEISHFAIMRSEIQMSNIRF